MPTNKTISINGRDYDAVTGMPVASSKEPAKPRTAPAPASAAAKKPAPSSHSETPSRDIHTTLQRSQTLHRRATKKPAAPQKPVLRRQVPGRHMDIAKHSNVAHFASHPAVDDTVHAVSLQTPKAAKKDMPAQVHPTAQRALQRAATKKAAPAKPPTAKQVKEAAITQALAQPTQKASTRKKGGASRSKLIKWLLIVGGIVVVLAAALFAIYQFVPSISVGIASSQAGIEASYPEYTPDGYSLSQPVTFSDGQVGLKFTSHSNDNYYTITQTRSSWDSSAVLDNVVTPAAGANYITTKERGLTIYTYDSSAAWVNGGLLYKIDSKAPLSGDQIRRIATSL